MAGTRRRLTAADRVEIALGLKAGWALRRIAAGIDRDVSVISREVARNSTKTRGYRMVTADVAAQRRRSRPQPRKVAVVPALRARVLADLKHSRTPRQIAGRLHLEAREATVGGYQMVCVRGGLRLKEIDCERDQGRQARPGGA